MYGGRQAREREGKERVKTRGEGDDVKGSGDGCTQKRTSRVLEV